MVRPVASLLLLTCAASLASGQIPGQEVRATWPERYGNAPQRLVPFVRGGPPHHRFFTAPQPYRGPRSPSATTREHKTLRVGLLIPSRDSRDGARSQMVRRAVEMAFEEANAKLPPGAPRREIIVKEDAPLWGSAANGMAELCLEQGVVAVIGSIDGAATHVALRVALKCGVFMVNTATNDPTLTETAIPWLLRCFPDDRQHAYRLARLIVLEQRRKHLAILRANDRYGRMGIREFVDSVRRLGRPVLIEMRYEPGVHDFEAQVLRIRDVEPDAVILWGDAIDLGPAVKSMRAAGIEAPFFGPDRLVDPVFLRTAGAAAHGTTATFPYDPARKELPWTVFRARFLQRFRTQPDQFAAYAYDGANLLLEALERTGDDRVGLRDHLAGLRRFTGVTGPMMFDPTHNNLAPLQVVRMENGSFRLE